MTVIRTVVAAGLVLAATTLAACSSSPTSARVEIVVHYSHFDPSSVTVPLGVPVTFVLVNEDPIEHEWLLGDAAFHERHRSGTEAKHGARPNEVSLPPLTTVETTLTFDRPEELQYICHFPGHEAYGMVGTLWVN